MIKLIDRIIFKIKVKIEELKNKFKKS